MSYECYGVYEIGKSLDLTCWSYTDLIVMGRSKISRNPQVLNLVGISMTEVPEHLNE